MNTNAISWCTKENSSSKSNLSDRLQGDDNGAEGTQPKTTPRINHSCLYQHNKHLHLDGSYFRQSHSGENKIETLPSNRCVVVWGVL